MSDHARAAASSQVGGVAVRRRHSHPVAQAPLPYASSDFLVLRSLIRVLVRVAAAIANPALVANVSACIGTSVQRGAGQVTRFSSASRSRLTTDICPLSDAARCAIVAGRAAAARAGTAPVALLPPRLVLLPRGANDTRRGSRSLVRCFVNSMLVVVARSGSHDARPRARLSRHLPVQVETTHGLNGSATLNHEQNLMPLVCSFRPFLCRHWWAAAAPLLNSAPLAIAPAQKT